MDLDPRYTNRNVELPYDLKADHIEKAVAETYSLFHSLNDYLATRGYRPFEELILGNSLSGIISEFLVKNVAKSSDCLIANRKVGGHPDLLPAGCYDSDLVLKGEEGIEIKASIQHGGWQGHNPEESWVMIFRYELPLCLVEIMCARLLKSDWSFSGRKGESRRTPTASITPTGVQKLRNNFVYRIPGVGIGPHKTILADNT